MIRQAVLVLDTQADPAAGAAERGWTAAATRIAGYPLLKRNLMMLQFLGVQDVFVLHGGARPALAGTLERDRDLSVRVRWVQDEGAEARGGVSLAAARRWLHGRTLVVNAETVYDHALVRAAAEASTPHVGVTVVVDRRRERLGDGVAAQLHGRRVSALVAAGEPAEATLVPVAVVDEAALPVVAGRTAEGAVTLAAGLRQQAERGGLWAVDAGSRFWIPIRDAAAARDAENVLWNSCRKPIDGIVARHINRNVSLAISRRIAHLPITPNHVSTLTFALGIAAAMCIVQGTWAWMALGVTLFKLNSILDGVDGELARIKYKASRLGEWLDTLSDDMSNMLVFGAVAYAAYANTGNPLYLWLGGLTLVPGVLTSAYQYHWLIRHQRGDLLAFRWVFQKAQTQRSAERGTLAAFIDSIKVLFKKDFFAMLTFVLGLVGLLPWMLFLTAFGYVALLVTVISNEIVIARLEREGRRYSRVAETQGIQVRR